MERILQCHSLSQSTEHCGLPPCCWFGSPLETGVDQCGKLRNTQHTLLIVHGSSDCNGNRMSSSSSLSMLPSIDWLQVHYLVVCAHAKFLEMQDSHPPSILWIGGLISRSCMCWKEEAWKRRMVGSYLMDTHTPSPTPIIWVISLFLRGCTIKAAYNMNGTGTQ